VYLNQYWLNMHKYDLVYATVDSLAEGVGSSQIAPLMEKLASHGMKINLMTFEKESPPDLLVERMRKARVLWTQIPFGNNGPLGGAARTFKLAKLMPDSEITHARSDFPAVAARFSGQDRILWDVRSLWADQRKFIEESRLKRNVLSLYGPFEKLASNSAMALSTLTHAVVSILEERYKHLPDLRIVVPTAVDLDRFKFSPVMPTKLKGLYSGTYNQYYDLELSRRFIEAVKRITDCEVDWAKPKESHADSLRAGESSIFSVTQPEMANLMSEYSFGISICKEDAGLSLKAAMPTKIAEFLAIGRPVVVNTGLGDCDELFANSKTGVVISRNDDLDQKAIELYELCLNPHTTERCRDLAEKHFSLDTGAESYMRLYKRMS
jgi:glycosyltransferase involved in cell wall biosynthesis